MTPPLQRLHRALIALAMLWAASATVQAQPLTAFPGAEGAGKWTIGGRAGRVIAVTNLNDAGAGSLRAAIDATGPRTIVFRTDGTIWLKSLLVVRNPYLTISGHTAPGDGITIAGHEFRIQASEVIVRYLRFRLGDQRRADLDAVSIMRGKNIILDHVSASWCIDEVLSVTPDARDVTVQWSLIAESLYRSVHSSGEPHGKGSLLRGRNGARLSFHHNLYAHHSDRAPMVQGLDPVAQDPLGVRLDFRNNVIYDWGAVAEGWEAAGANRSSESTAQVNFVNNAYLPGPGTAPGWLPITQSPFFAYRYWAFEELSTHARAHWSGNTFNGELWKNNAGNLDPTWMVSVPRSLGSAYFLPTPMLFDNAELPAISADVSTADVLAKAGASHRRDAVDLRILNQVQNGTGDLINSQTDVGGWPVLATGVAPTDRDGDGLPDGWETARGLNPAYRPDSLRRAPDGRTWVETYHAMLLETNPVHLTITSEGHGTASASLPRLPLGGVSPLSVTPEEGYIVDRVLQNGVPIPLASLAQTPDLWADTTLHFIFARPRIPVPAELVRPVALQLARHPMLNADLGGMLHLNISAQGTLTGSLWNGQTNRAVVGEVIAREHELPRIDITLPVTKALPLKLSLEFHSPSDVRGTLTQGDASAALAGWTSPWHKTKQPLPLPQRGIHTATLIHPTDPLAPTASLSIQASTDGVAYLTVRFSDRRVALCNTRLSPEGRWLLWSRPYTGRAPTHGLGQLDSAAQLTANLSRLGAVAVPYSTP